MADTQMTTQITTEITTYGEHHGIVKWFSNRKGYGFLTIVSDNRKGEDIFVHQTYVRPNSSDYRALNAGEYVSFNIKDGTETERSQAIDVTGVCGGPLQCDRPRPQTQRYNNSRGQGQGQGQRYENNRNRSNDRFEPAQQQQQQQA